MESLKSFIDRISSVERNGGVSVVIPLAEAKIIRDDLTKLLLNMNSKMPNEPIKIELTGGKW